ncbi:MAG: hypothetical protein SW833_12270 [Cyanobacteriota bacterium]|nr:hypothetical protein [Cyanobacteriota bacterium]
MMKIFKFFLIFLTSASPIVGYGQSEALEQSSTPISNPSPQEDESTDSIPTQTLSIPHSPEAIDAETWCQAPDAVAMETPFALTRIRFYADETEAEEREYLIGCLTNNTRETVEDIPTDYILLGDSFGFKIGLSSISTPTLEPGQTGFFKTEFRIPPDTHQVVINLTRVIQEELKFTFEPVQKLIIERQE